jgi:nicotinamidase-related amidase
MHGHDRPGELTPSGTQSAMLARLEDSVLVVVDVQPSVLDLAWERQRVLDRASFLIRVAGLLDVPVIVTEQNPARLGGTATELDPALGSHPRGAKRVSKMDFSCWGEPAFQDAWDNLGRGQAVLVGIESHICVCQTAHDLLELEDDVDVLVCEDAVSARTEGMHRNGLRRMRDEGVALAHTESVAYEWLRSAEHPAFRDVLRLVKEGN